MTTWWLISSLIQTANWGVSNSSHVHRKSRGSMVQLRVRRAVLVQRENSFSQNTTRQWQVYRSQIYVNTTCAGKGGDVITTVSSINPLRTAYCLFSGLYIRFKLDLSLSQSWDSLCCTRKIGSIHSFAQTVNHEVLLISRNKYNDEKCRGRVAILSALNTSYE